MPGKLDNVMPAVASRLVNQFGAEATLRTLVRIIDPVNQVQIGSTVVDKEIIITPPERFETRQFLGSVIQEGDVLTQIDAAQLDNTPPEIGSQIIFNSSTYRIVFVATIWSGRLPAVYQMQIRN